MSIESIRFISLGIIIFSASILIALERFIPYKKGQKFFREEFLNDFILYNFVQSFVLGIIISYFIVYIDDLTVFSSFKIISSWPVWVQLVFFIITHDLYIYWFHRLQHKNKYLWRIHEAHHSARSVDWLSGVRSHSLEIFINQTIEFAPIVLLGAAPEVAIYKGTISAVWGMYIHSNINVRSGKLQYFINGPEMHRWHHADDDNKDAYNKNFSTKLAVWDWLFKTAFFPRGKKPLKYGISSVPFPAGYLHQHMFAFRRFRKK